MYAKRKRSEIRNGDTVTYTVDLAENPVSPALQAVHVFLPFRVVVDDNIGHCEMPVALAAMMGCTLYQR